MPYDLGISRLKEIYLNGNIPVYTKIYPQINSAIQNSQKQKRNQLPNKIR